MLANQENINCKKDIMFLTKETERLNQELKQTSFSKIKMQEQLQLTLNDLENFKNQENRRFQELSNEFNILK
jgi:hypothetical protein